MLKKTIASTLLAATMIGTISIPAHAAILPPIKTPSLAIDLVVDGKKATLPDIEPFIDAKGNTMIPLRFISEKLGAKVLWDNTKQIVTIKQDAKTIIMPVGASTATINGEPVTLTTTASKKEGSVVVPLRFVSEALGVTVKWDGGSYAINITSAAYQTKVDSGKVTLDDYGREIAEVQDSKEWLVMSDVPDWAYAIVKPEVLGGTSNANAKDFINRTDLWNKAIADKVGSRIKDYYKLALNLDYRTIDKTSYYQQNYNLLGHLGYVPVEPYNAFVNHIKKNKLIVEGYAYPDMNMTYIKNGVLIVRTKFKFKVISGDYSKGFNADSFDVGSASETPKFVKKGKWYYGYADVLTFSNVMNDVIGGSKVGTTENMFVKNSHLYKELK